MATSTKEAPDFAGDYILDSIKIRSFDGKPVDVKSMVQELNIYESIYDTTLSGSAVIVDGINLVNKMPLQGTEMLEFLLYTPGAGNSSQGRIDATAETGNPFHIYKLSNRKRIGEGVVSYVLHFCSREAIQSVRTRVSQAYDGALHGTAAAIFADKQYLDSRKKLYVEPTRNRSKVVIPNLHPLDAILSLAPKALSGKSNGVGYFFYETTKGFHFRSWDSLISLSGEQPRPIAAEFDYFPRRSEDVNTPEKTKIKQDYEAVENYEFLHHYNTMAQQAYGTYAQKVITHNIYDKTYDTYNWRYHNWYSELKHADDTGHNDHNKYPIAKVPVDYEGEKTVSDYEDSVVTLQNSTRFLHGYETGKYGIDKSSDGLMTAIRNSTDNTMENGIRIKMTIHGLSYLEAGDVIWFGLRSVEPDKGKDTSPVDMKYAGRYVITKLRHRVTADDYKQVIECVKDSVFTAYGTGTYVHEPKNEKGLVINQYNLDESILGRQMGHHG